MNGILKILLDDYYKLNPENNFNKQKLFNDYKNDLKNLEILKTLETKTNSRSEKTLCLFNINFILIGDDKNKFKMLKFRKENVKNLNIPIIKKNLNDLFYRIIESVDYENLFLNKSFLHFTFDTDLDLDFDSKMFFNLTKKNITFSIQKFD